MQDIVPVRFIYHTNILLLTSNGGLTSIIECSTTLTLRARITAPDRISYLKLLPWYLMNKTWSSPTVRPILLTSLFVNLKFVPVSDLVLLCWLCFSPCRHMPVPLIHPTNKTRITNTHKVINTHQNVLVIYRVCLMQYLISKSIFCKAV